MISVGLTGGIGSGKSEVAKLWEKRGATVLFADDLAKKLMVTSSEVRKQLTKTFGEDVYDKSGQLNKPFLIREAFEKNRVEELNAIVHPAVYAETERLMGEARRQGCKVFVKEAALLLNNGRPENLDKIVLVDAPQELRVKRVSERDGVSEDEVIARIKKQPDFSRLHHLCDYIIENDGDYLHLREEADRVFDRILQES